MGLGSRFWARFGSGNNVFWSKKNSFSFFRTFWAVPFCAFSENGSSSVFTFEKIPVCLVFFRVFLLSLITNKVSHTGLGSAFWVRFGSEKGFSFGRKNFCFLFPDVLGSFFCVFQENRSSSVFTFEKIPVCLVFFRVLLLYLIVNKRSYTRLGSGFFRGVYPS